MMQHRITVYALLYIEIGHRGAEEGTGRRVRDSKIILGQRSMYACLLFLFDVTD